LLPNRSASTSTWIVIDVFPTLIVFAVEAHQVADKDGLVKDHLFHRDRDESFVLCMTDRLDATRDVDVTKDDPPKTVPWALVSRGIIVRRIAASR
jgi:hypothetical protein